jgi:hypothetical protein
MASKKLTLVFECTLTQLAAAARRTLGLRNLLDADSIIGRKGGQEAVK